MVLRIAALAIGYLFGTFQTGYIYGKLKGVDIRNYGSGNTGATNSLRTFGWKGVAGSSPPDPASGRRPVPVSLERFGSFWCISEGFHCAVFLAVREDADVSTGHQTLCGELPAD